MAEQLTELEVRRIQRLIHQDDTSAALAEIDGLTNSLGAHPRLLLLRGDALAKSGRLAEAFESTTRRVPAPTHDGARAKLAFGPSMVSSIEPGCSTRRGV